MPPGGKVIAKPCCKDCKSTTRVLNCPGPRCVTCWRIVVRARKEAAHDRHVDRSYEISAAEYKILYEGQGGRCWICRRATGKTKRLSVDHDHKTNKVRGLLCSSCNYGVIGHLRDDVEALERAAAYLRNPPADAILEEARCRNQSGIQSS